MTESESVATFTPTFPNGLKAFNSEIPLSEAYKMILSICDEGPKGCIKPEELALSLTQSAEKRFQLKAYDGFEPSGRMHIAQGLLKTINVNKLTRSGVRFIFLVADWFAQLNNKMGGDLKKIKTVGLYFEEVWRACGMDLSKVDFLWSSDEVNKRPEEYWSLVMDLARKNNVSRIKRCGQIMGRTDPLADKQAVSDTLSAIFKNREKDAELSEADFIEKYADQLMAQKADPQPVAQLLYPLMQCADIFFLGANFCQLGTDQLKVNVLAREYCDSRGKKEKRLRKPVILSHPMLMGLKEGQTKMSKSDPDSAIFMEDTAEEVTRKIRSAFCKPGDVETNPVLDYARRIVFPWYEMKSWCSAKDEKTKSGLEDEGYLFKIERKEEDGGNIEYCSYEALMRDFNDEKLHPGDLKSAVAREVNLLLDPVRKHFSHGKAKELLKTVKVFSAKK